MSRRCVWALVIVGLSAAQASANPTAALDEPPFTAPASELLELGNAAPAADEAIVLREDHELTFDDDGRRRRRMRMVFVVKNDVAATTWREIRQEWRTSHQDRPTLDARAIAPDGTVAQLAATSITDEPWATSKSGAHSDRRELVVTLPELQRGSVVEYELIVQDREPLLGTTTGYFISLGGSVPVSSTRVTVSAPSRLAVRVQPQKMPKVKIARQVVRGRVTWKIAYGALAPTPLLDWSVPPDLEPRTGIMVNTATWPEVARAYTAVVERAIADAPFTLPSDLPKTQTLDTVRRITAWMHRRIEYSGLELGSTSVIPEAPGRTFDGGSGDGKDLAVLLVAALRQAGIRADVALVAPGSGLDLPANMPMLSHLHHAIVRVRVGGRDVWIDPTERAYPVGLLPARLQGRRALVIAKDTRGLVNTPRSPAKDNVTREVRTFELAEIGSALRITERTTAYGVPGASQRSWLRDNPGNLATYIEDEYAATFERYTTNDLEDPTLPSEITIFGKEVGRAYTERSHIDVRLYPGDTLENVASTWKQNDEDEVRRYDFVWEVPHVYEIENRLVVPTGYTMPTPAAPVTHKLGTATLTERQRIEGQTFIVQFRFESGKPRLTPREVTALRRELRKIASEERKLTFSDIAWKLTEEGKLAEAKAEVERRMRVHPNEAVHHGQLALVLMEAGLGTAARRAAKKGIEIEPKNADAHVVYAWSLRHDSIGREFGYDHDRAGSLRAYEKARTLDPTHVGAASDHAALLERNHKGDAYAPGADLRAAAAAWRAAWKLDESEEHGLGLVRVLMRIGELEEAVEVLDELDASDDRDALLIAAIAAGPGGVAAARARADEMRSGDDYKTLMNAAGGTLLFIREYARAKQLFAEGDLSWLPYGETYKKLTRTKRPATSSDPRDAAFDTLLLVFFPTYEAVGPLDARTREELGDEVSRSWSMLESMRTAGMDFARDLLRVMVTSKVEGKAKGPWRVELEIMGRTHVMYAALDKSVAKIVGSAASRSGVGRYMLTLLDRGQDAAAQQLARWFDKDGYYPNGLMVSSTSGARDRDDLALYAAYLAAETDPRATRILQKCASTVPNARALCDRALLGIYAEREQWTEVETVAASLHKAGVDVGRIHAKALVELGRTAEAEQVIAREAKANNSTRGLEIISGELWLARKDYTKALEALEPGVVREDPASLNNSAWIYIATEDYTTGIELARKAVGFDVAYAPSNRVGTLAALEAENGELQQASRHVHQSMHNDERDVPESQDWYVIGRIAEHLGMRDDAIAAYRKVKRETSSDPYPDSYMFAQRRLQRLGVRP